MLIMLKVQVQVLTKALTTFLKTVYTYYYYQAGYIYLHIHNKIIIGLELKCCTQVYRFTYYICMQYLYSTHLEKQKRIKKTNYNLI